VASTDARAARGVFIFASFLIVAIDDVSLTSVESLVDDFSDDFHFNVGSFSRGRRIGFLKKERGNSMAGCGDV